MNYQAELEAYAARSVRDFELLDNLPADVRALVHEFGAKRVVQLWHIGMKPAAIRAQLTP